MSDNMIVNAIQKISEMAEKNIGVVEYSLDERPYTNIKPVPLLEPTPVTLHGSSLQSVVDFISAEFGDDFEGFIHVVGEDRVSVYGLCSHLFVQRDEWFRSGVDATAFPFGQYMPVEDFIVRLQSQFVATPERAAILSVVGSLSDEDVKTITDDGVTQTVNVRAGVAFKSTADLPNPVTLKPYRTFREVDQPEGLFVLRMVKMNGAKPHLALHEADGGAWKIEAVANIKAWLAGKLPNINIIG